MLSCEFVELCSGGVVGLWSCGVVDSYNYRVVKLYRC